MEDYEETEVTGKSSKINSAMIVNITVNELFKNFFRHFSSGRYLSCNNDLDCIWVILGGEPDIENSDTEKKYNSINKNLFELGNLCNSLQVKGFNEVDAKCLLKLNKQKQILLDKALFLSRLRNKQGKGTAYQNEDEDDFD